MNGTQVLAALLGAATGLRSTAGFAILATSDDIPKDSRLRGPAVKAVALAAAAGEALADKVAPLPPRTEPAPLAGRAALGAAAGALVARWRGEDALGPALLAAGAAVTAAWAATAIRRQVQRRSLPDEWPALAEDLAVVGLGKAVHDELAEERSADRSSRR